MLLLSGGALPAQMTLRQTVEVASARNVVFSPRGDEFAYVVTYADLDANAQVNELRIASVSGAAPHTVVRAESITASAWSQDGQRLFYLTKVDGRYRLCAWDRRTEKTQVVLLDDNGIGAGMADNNIEALPPFALSPTRDKAAYVTRDLVKGRREMEAMLDSGFRYTGEWSIMVAMNPERFLLQSQPSAAPALWVIDLSTGLHRQVWRSPIATIDELPVRFEWSPDGSRVAVVARTEHGARNLWELLVVSATDGTVATLVSQLGFVTRIAWTEDGRSIDFHSEGSLADPHTPRYNYRWLRINVGTRQVTPSAAPEDRRAKLTARLLAATGDKVRELAFTPEHAAGVREEAMQPPAVMLYTLDPGGRVRQAKIIDPINEGLDAVKLGETQTLQFNLPNGDSVKAGLVLPVGYDARRRYPLVVMYYNQYREDRFMGAPLFTSYAPQVFAANGFVVLMPRTPENEYDYTPGDFERALARHPEGIAGQLKAMIQILDQRGVVDLDRMGIMGWSFGAFYAPYILTHYPDWFRAGAMGEGGSNHRPSAYWMGNDEVRAAENAFYGGGPYGKFRDRWLRVAPIENVAALRAPMLLEHSAAFISGVEMNQAVLEHGGQSEFHVYLKELHLFRRPSNRLESAQRHFEWFNFWLKGAEVTRPGAEEQYARWRKMRTEWEAKQAGKPGFGSVN